MVLIWQILLGATLAGASPFVNLSKIIADLNFVPVYESSRLARPVKIAVINNGFRNYQKEIGKSLPVNTKYHSGPFAPPEPEEQHGLVMAQLVSALLSNDQKNQKIPYEIHLLSGYGYSNFKSAVETVINEQIDVVLYAQVWEYGGNFDGHGFINAIVDKAIRSGVFWVNASGNFGQNTFNTPIRLAADNWVSLPGENESVHIRCKENETNKCRVRVVLSWNDFKDDVSLGTNKDLDLILTDDTLTILSRSTLIQKTEIDTNDVNQSKYPREILETILTPGLYFLRVKARSRDFNPLSSRLRITTSGDYIEMVHRDSTETLLNPADNSAVITVGASDTDNSSRSINLAKPDIYAPSLIILSEDEKYKGSSQSSAIVAASAAMFKSFFPKITKAEFLSQITKKNPHGAQLIGTGLPLNALGFASTQPQCFVPVPPPPFVPPPAIPLLAIGGTYVHTTMGEKIFMPEDPIMFFPGLRRIQYNDMIILNPQGSYLRPRPLVPLRLPPHNYEVVQTPHAQAICGLTQSALKLFSIPSAVFE